MNLLLALVVLLGSPKEPQVCYFNGKSLLRIGTLELPNVGQVDLRLFIQSPHELKAARIDSTEVELCIPRCAERKTLKLKGRWYIVSWHTDLKVGAEKHTLWLSCNSGKKLRASFVVQVEGTKKLNKPNGIYK